MATQPKIYAFPYEFSEDNSTNEHNISIAIGVIGRKKKINAPATGDIAIAYDNGEEGTYASVHIIMEPANIHDYWGNDSDIRLPNQFTTHVLAGRQLVKSKIGVDDGKDNSDVLAEVYKELVKKTFDNKTEK
jgi:hypothetical protein